MNKNIFISIKKILLFHMIVVYSIFSSNQAFSPELLLSGLKACSLDKHKELLRECIDNGKPYSNEHQEKDIAAFSEILKTTETIKKQYETNWPKLNKEEQEAGIKIAKPLAVLHGFVSTILKNYQNKK